MSKMLRAVIAISLCAVMSPMANTNVSAATPTSYYNNCGYPEYKPQSLTQYCADAGTGVTKIKWSSWTNTKATGTGSYYVNQCNPNCADGKLIWAKVRVVLSSPRMTHGKRYLMTVSVSSINGKTLPGESKSSTTSWVTDYWMG